MSECVCVSLCKHVNMHTSVRGECHLGSLGVSECVRGCGAVSVWGCPWCEGVSQSERGSAAVRCELE